MTTREYEGEGITVHWDSSRCIHVAACIRAAPEVFDPQARPWIDVEAAEASRIADAVSRCPTGALRFSSERISERVPDQPVMRPVRGGPMIVRGPIEVTDHGGRTLCRETRVALCRCGNSSNQPFCDNSHRRAGFEEPELRAPEPPAEAEAPDEICEPQDGFGDV